MSEPSTDPTVANTGAPGHVSQTKPLPGSALLGLGLFLPILGIALYVAQVRAQRLTIPWYLPALCALGVVFAILSLWQARSVWRGIGFVVVLLLAGLGSAFVLVPNLPEYTGPVAAGKPFPAFTTHGADGTSFTQRDLSGDANTVMVFFRGRW
jgi:hypothetical protein